MPERRRQRPGPPHPVVVGVDLAREPERVPRELLVHPGDHRRLFHIWRRIREGDFPRGVALRMPRPDGTTRIVSCAFSALLDSEGRVDEMAALLTADATARTPGGAVAGAEAVVALARRNHRPGWGSEE